MTQRHSPPPEAARIVAEQHEQDNPRMFPSSRYVLRDSDGYRMDGRLNYQQFAESIAKHEDPNQTRLF